MVYVLYSFRRVLSGFFYVSQEQDKLECCETEPTVLRPYPRKTRKSCCLQMSLQRQHFLSKTLSVGPAEVWNRDLLLSRPAPSQLSRLSRQPLKKKRLYSLNSKLVSVTFHVISSHGCGGGRRWMHRRAIVTAKFSSFMHRQPIGHFIVIDGNEARADFVLI